MTTLERISMLMEQNGWTKYKLAQESGMSPSVISNIFKRGGSPTVATIEAICKAFGITLSQFFEFGTDTLTVQLTEDQKRMFDRWITLTEDQKDLFYRFIENMK